MSKKVIYNSLLLTCLYCFFTNTSFGQSGLNIHLENSLFTPYETKNELLLQLNNAHLSLSRPSSVSEVYKSTQITDWHQSKEMAFSINKIRIHRNYTSNHLIGLGGFENYIDQLQINSQNGSFIFGYGLTLQNDYNTSNATSIQLNLSVRYDHSLNNWLSIYTYGQYLSSDVRNNSKLSPLINMNPLFMQSEAGIGLIAKYRNLKLDVGTKTIFDTQFQKSKPLNMMNSKLKVGF
ncbi:MAG: hypothetical protein N4A74_19670 [Carboxylicivirga sp.]|jgi:hypothetical protein|nr:hypothetical protein [Carboxylicivirga sp.]